MSITDELRDWASNHYSGWPSKQAEGFAIADRIDAEHERAEQDLIDANNQMEQLCECSVELPLDADGEYIHIGDVMESKGGDFLFGEASFEVRSMRCDECGWEVYDRLGDRYAPSLLRHHHAPTVEDVLREFAVGIRDQNADFAELVIAEYTKKLREMLAGDVV